MATYYLVNPVLLNNVRLLPGHLVDDAATPLPVITAAGGEVWPSSDATVASMAAIVTSGHTARGMSEAEMESRMRASTEASLLSTAGATTAAVAALAVTLGALTLSNIPSGVASLVGVADVFIDSVAGNDTTGTGAVGSPLKTHAEFERRLGLGPASAFVGGVPRVTWALNVHIVNDLAITDPIRLDVIAAGEGSIWYHQHGTVATPYTGTFTSVTVARSAPDTPQDVTDTALTTTTWTTVGLGTRIRVASGTRVNALTWVSKDLGSNKTRTPGLMAGVPSVSGTNPFPATITAGDPYVVETLRKVYVGTLRVKTDGIATSTFNNLTFSDLDIQNPGFGALCPDVDCILSWAGCRFRCTYDFSHGSQTLVNFSSCYFDKVTVFMAGGYAFGGCVFNAVAQGYAGFAYYDFDCLFQGGALVIGGLDVYAGFCGFFDATVGAINTGGDAVSIGGNKFLGSGGSFISGTRSSGHLVYGSGNAGYGIRGGPGAKEISFQTNAPTVNGALGVFAITGGGSRSLVGGPTQLRAISRAGVAGTVNQITNAGAYPYTSASFDVIVLPDHAKCRQNNQGNGTLANAASSNFGSGWARAGTGTLGGLVPNLAVGASQFAVSPTGDILLNAGDAWSSVDIGYLTEEQAIVSGTYSCTAGTGVVAGLPANIVSILEAEVLVGGVAGKCIVQNQAATAPTTGKACLTLGKTGVFFCIADAATSVRLKLGVATPP